MCLSSLYLLLPRLAGDCWSGEMFNLALLVSISQLSRLKQIKYWYSWIYPGHTCKISFGFWILICLVFSTQVPQQTDGLWRSGLTLMPGAAAAWRKTAGALPHCQGSCLACVVAKDPFLPAVLFHILCWSSQGQLCKGFSSSHHSIHFTRGKHEMVAPLSTVHMPWGIASSVPSANLLRIRTLL